jgi:anti-sigma factor RsiW
MNGTPHDPTRLSPQAWEALEETLSAFALGALPEAEAAAVARHAAGCPTCRGLTAELTAGASLLAAAAAPAEPSAGLRQRLLAAAQAEQRNGAPLDVPAAPIPFPGPPPTGMAPRARGRGAAWFPWLATAAALLVSLSVGVWNAQMRGEAREQAEVLAVYENASRLWPLAGTAEAPRARGVVAAPASGGPPVVLLHDLPRLDRGRTYQVWVIRDGQPASAAVLRPGPAEQHVVELQQGLAGVQTVAVSVEPAGGSPSPTGPIVLAGNL